MRYIISFLLTSALASGLTPAAAEVPKVMTDIVPVHALTAQVMGDLGAPDLLLEQGANAHDLQLRPSQAAQLAQADLVIWVGPEMTPWLDRALSGLAEGTPRLGLLALPQTHRQNFGAPAAEAHDHDHGHNHDHSHEHGHDHGHDHGHEGHSHSGLDPHAWLDPQNAQYWLVEIARELGKLDPANAATYSLNAQSAAQELAELDQRLKAQLAPAAAKPFITFHDAYGYFTAHYGLTSLGSIALGDASSPGAAHLRALSEKLAGTSTLCLFPEAQHDPRQIEILSEDSPAKIGQALDPEGSLIAAGPQAYASLLTSMADSLTACLTQ